MTTKYNRNFTETFPFSDTGVMILLTASLALPWTIPGNSTQKFRACFSTGSDDNVWVSKNGTATVPITNNAIATYNQERIGVNFVRYVSGGDVLSFISTGTPQVGVSLLLVEDQT